MKATRRDFEQVAAILAANQRYMLQAMPLARRATVQDRHYQMCKGIAEVFNRSNPAFKFSVFMAACEVI